MDYTERYIMDHYRDHGFHVEPAPDGAPWDLTVGGCQFQVKRTSGETGNVSVGERSPWRYNRNMWLVTVDPHTGVVYGCSMGDFLDYIEHTPPHPPAPTANPQEGYWLWRTKSRMKPCLQCDRTGE